MERGIRDQMMGGGPRGGGGGHGGWEAGLSSGFGWWFGICLTLIAISLVTLTVFAVLGWFRTRGGAGAGDEGDPDARATLDQRLATGEIGPDDYARRLAALRTSPPPGTPPA